MEDVALLRARPGIMPAHIAHGFTTRAGGVARGALDSLTLAPADALDAPELVENWRRALAALHPGLRPKDLALMRQVHGGEVVFVDRPTGPLAAVPQVDGMVTTTPGLVLAVRVADCVPVLLSAPGGVAAVHAGWRGVAAGVVGRAVRMLCEVAGHEPAEVRAVIGPCISREAYEVGGEVIDGMVRSGVPREVAGRVDGDRWRADCGGSVAYQLSAAGVGVIDRVERCTSHPTLFSWRHDGPGTGRQAGLVVRWS